MSLPDLTGALGRALAAEKDGWDESGLHVSDLAAGLPSQQDRMCRRLLWLRLRGYEKKETSLWQRLMWDHGKRIEERVNDLIKDHLNGGWVIVEQKGNERRVELPFGITGTYDLMLQNKHTGKRVIVDNKTIRGRAFNFLDTAKPSHVIQVRGYLMGADVNDGMLWYIDREGQNHPVTFHVERRDEFVKTAMDIILDIQDLSYPPLPMRPKFGINHGKTKVSITAGMPWQCDWCDYLDVSCGGALPKEMRSAQGRVVGWLKVDEDGVLVEHKPDYSDIKVYNQTTFEEILYSEEEHILNMMINN